MLDSGTNDHQALFLRFLCFLMCIHWFCFMIDTPNPFFSIKIYRTQTCTANASMQIPATSLIYCTHSFFNHAHQGLELHCHSRVPNLWRQKHKLPTPPSITATYYQVLFSNIKSLTISFFNFLLSKFHSSEHVLLL